MKAIPITLSLLLLTACAQERKIDNAEVDPIRINQVGYFTNQSKTAVIEEVGFSDSYRIQDMATAQVVWEGKASRTSSTPWSGKKHQIVDFSTINKPGEYVIKAGEYSKKLIIADHPYQELTLASMKAFYYQRTGEPITEEFAGVYNRPSSHPDTAVLVHASAASKDRPEGTLISSPGGWFDAGDYNKYIVNSGFTIGEILTIYQFHDRYFNAMKLNIPESDNTTPDVLDELLVNLKWMLTMQDADGGVYHKLTNAGFDDFKMPSECNDPRYVVQKTTPATLDFAATMALASRIYRIYPEHKEFAKEALEAAIKAWSWSRKNPKLSYRQNEMNEKFEPKVFTGAYDDEEFRDEFLWAATELYFTTSKRMFLNEAASRMPKQQPYTLPVWGQVDGLAAMEWMVQTSFGYSPETERFGNIYTKKLVEYCDGILNTLPTSLYDSPYGNTANDFGWGCMAEICCGKGLSLLFAYKMTGEKKYLDAAIKCADYILGRNATGYCYVTGFGQKPAMHPHHRISESDGIVDPIPGLLIGGPNPGQQDNLADYPSKYPDESYLDRTDSYASNEIAINWNAGLFSFIGWLSAEVK